MKMCCASHSQYPAARSSGTSSALHAGSIVSSVSIRLKLQPTRTSSTLQAQYADPALRRGRSYARQAHVVSLRSMITKARISPPFKTHTLPCHSQHPTFLRLRGGTSQETSINAMPPSSRPHSPGAPCRSEISHSPRSERWSLLVA